MRRKPLSLNGVRRPVLRAGSWRRAMLQRRCSHSLAWGDRQAPAGLVLPIGRCGRRGCAPQPAGGALERSARWIHLLTSLQQVLTDWTGPHSRRRGRSVAPSCSAVFGRWRRAGWELQLIARSNREWNVVRRQAHLLASRPVVAPVLEERALADSGRFGHRSGALNGECSSSDARHPYRVIALIGLDAWQLPRLRQRPGFHCGEAAALRECPARRSGPLTADGGPALARDNLLLFLNCANETQWTQAAAAWRQPIRQCWSLLAQANSASKQRRNLVIAHRPNPLDRQNFPARPRTGSGSCDRVCSGRSNAGAGPRAPG